MGASVALAGLLAAGPAPAQEFPNRPVRMVVPFPPGAASDFLARVLGQKLTEAWGQQIVVDNRPGAGGLIGGTVVARATPDGYTIALIGQPHLTAALLSKEPPWDPLKDFSHIGLVASMPNVLTVGPGLQVNSLSELIAQVKAKPGYYNVGSAGMGSSSHLAAEMFNAAAGLKSVHVPFKLIGDIIAEMYGGRIHYYLFPLPAVMPVLRKARSGPSRPADAHAPSLCPRFRPCPKRAFRGSCRKPISGCSARRLCRKRSSRGSMPRPSSS